MKVFRHHPDAKLPQKGSENAAGYDLFALKDGAAWATPHKVETGISISIPEGTYARIAPRSSLAVKYGVDVLAGVVDFDFRGEIVVVLINHCEEAYHYKKGDKIAQLILEKIDDDTILEEVDELDKLGNTQRGIGGFGSTGV